MTQQKLKTNKKNNDTQIQTISFCGNKRGRSLQFFLTLPRTVEGIRKERTVFFLLSKFQSFILERQS